MLKKTVFLWITLSMLLLTACGQGTAPATAADPAELNAADFFAMDTYMEIKGYGASDELLQEAEAQIHALESRLSATLPDSEIALLNASGAAEVSDDTAFLLEKALALCAETDGALDISMYPIVKAWGFTTADYHVPTDGEVASLLQKVGYTRIEQNGRAVTLQDGMEIDLGAVTKGYVVDVLAGLFEEHGVENALFNLGGNVLTMGTKPDGSLWRVGVKDPEGSGSVGVMTITGKALITSGGYERYFEDENGNVYWHIMDPETGRPAKSGLVSVTVIGDNGLYCDALSTALFIKGAEGAMDFWTAHRDFDMILITDAGEIIMTPDAAAAFTPADGCQYELVVMEDA